MGTLPWSKTIAIHNTYMEASGLSTHVPYRFVLNSIHFKPIRLISWSPNLVFLGLHLISNSNPWALYIANHLFHLFCLTRSCGSFPCER